MKPPLEYDVVYMNGQWTEHLRVSCDIVSVEAGVVYYLDPDGVIVFAVPVERLVSMRREDGANEGDADAA